MSVSFIIRGRYRTRNPDLSTDPY